jgi:hypothetical protein
MRILNHLLASACLFSATATIAAKNDKQPEFTFDCKADREFITTYEYLKRKKELGIKPEDMRKVALAVTSGCTGAASSFIEATELLLKAGLDGKTAIEQARDLAVKGADFAQAFNAIFRGAFASELLDMDIGSSLRIARKLTTDFKGDPAVASEDYAALAKFCVEAKGLDLPKPECATMAAKIAGYSEESKLPVAKTFIRAFDYLTRNKDMNLNTRDAINLAESLVEVSPEAFATFKNTYEYASDTGGLGLTRADAISFAKSVSMNTKQKKPM